jgi:predicted nucleotidyltransferase
MLKIINDLKPFFKDCYREISVREYSRISKITPPTASKLLKTFEKEQLLKSKSERNYLLFRANRENYILRDLSRIYWKIKLKKLIEELNLKFNFPTIILFGSLAKLESKKDSDIDIAIISKLNKKINTRKFEKEYKRNIQLFSFKSFEKINKELKNNIIKGYFIKEELN